MPRLFRRACLRPSPVVAAAAAGRTGASRRHRDDVKIRLAAAMTHYPGPIAAAVGSGSKTQPLCSSLPLGGGSPKDRAPGRSAVSGSELPSRTGGRVCTRPHRARPRLSAPGRNRIESIASSKQ
ncbi:hypothetical protein LA76x_0210 [Lysobacter antibioticus]|uniref:Uncharacterized protein n=1 Tax=Lysobacter antibioticus TaxID=84531 RepID=A0A0S2F498_LYSAN|nr:hypothetical protein LA76x_0210 [Lysobacter antibioticus]